MTAPASDPVWFITGCSTGFGRELARLVLQRGGRAVVTARDAERVADLVDGAGDPARAAAAMIALAEMPDPPRHLVLGEWGHDAVVAKLKQRLAEIEGTRELSVGADFPKDR